MTENKDLNKKSLSAEQKNSADSPSLSRRKTINTLVITGGIATVDKWGKPIVDSVVTPVHANMSVGGGGDGGDGTTPTPPPASPSATPAVTPSATPVPSPSATPAPSPSASPSPSPSPSTSIFVTGNP